MRVDTAQCELDNASDCTTVMSSEESDWVQLPTFFHCIPLASPPTQPANETPSDSFELSSDGVNLRVVPEASTATWPVARLGQLRGRQRFRLFERNGMHVFIFQTCNTVERLTSPRKSRNREETVQIEPTLIELVVTVDPALSGTWLQGKRIRPREPLTLAAIPMDQFRKHPKGKGVRIEVEGRLTRDSECLLTFQHRRCLRIPKEVVPVVTEKQRQDAAAQTDFEHTHRSNTVKEVCVVSCGVRWDLSQVERLRRIGVVVFTHPTPESYRRTTVLVVQPPLHRSVKLFCTLPFLEHVVTPSWVEATLQTGSVAAMSDFPLSCDERSESSESRLRALILRICHVPPVSRQDLFRGKKFFFEPEVQPQTPGNDVKECITCSGGQLVSDRSSSDVVVVPDTFALITSAEAETVVKLEQIFLSILRQKLVWEPNRKRGRNEADAAEPGLAVC
jgi:hypothetical protein